MNAMLDANTLDPPLDIGEHFALEARPNTAVLADTMSQETHHIPAGEGRQAVADQLGIQPLQDRRVLQAHVSRPLTLAHRPVIRGASQVGEQLLVNGVELPDRSEE